MTFPSKVSSCLGRSPTKRCVCPHSPSRLAWGRFSCRGWFNTFSSQRCPTSRQVLRTVCSSLFKSPSGWLCSCSIILLIAVSVSCNKAIFNVSFVSICEGSSLCFLLSILQMRIPSFCLFAYNFFIHPWLILTVSEPACLRQKGSLVRHHRGREAKNGTPVSRHGRGHAVAVNRSSPCRRRFVFEVSSS